MQASKPSSRGPDPAHHAVEVGVVVEAEPAGVVDDLDPALDVRVVDPHVVGVARPSAQPCARDTAASSAASDG